ncbi:MAG: L-rhamnose mutarotase [Bacteroidales bacterium]|jgi:L-rhamnose mutarotase|nr:L-rhamnose mutarotase [Bacteroidales bacterium]
MFKRYCKTLKLKNDPALIKEYKRVHSIGNTWPEISQGMKETGIIDMEIYLYGNQLFMIMDTVPDFDHEKAMRELAGKPRQAEWEAFVSRFQISGENATADEKWQLMERIYELDQKAEFRATDGQLKEK